MGPSDLESLSEVIQSAATKLQEQSSLSSHLLAPTSRHTRQVGRISKINENQWKIIKKIEKIMFSKTLRKRS